MNLGITSFILILRPGVQRPSFLKYGPICVSLIPIGNSQPIYGWMTQSLLKNLVLKMEEVNGSN